MKKIKPVYVTKVGVDGKGHRMRCMKTLRNAIKKVLTENDVGMSLRPITELVSARDDLTLAVLEDLYAAGDVQRYKARNPNRPGREDQFWCLAGRVPVKTGNRFKGLETLEAFQIAARQAYGQGARA